MTPAEVPDALVQKAAQTFAATVKVEWGGPGTEWSITVAEEPLRQALAAVLPGYAADVWDEGASLAARAAVILGGPSDLPTTVKGHNPYRATTTEDDRGDDR